MKVCHFRHVKSVILSFLFNLLLFNASEAGEDKECFFQAHLTKPAQFGPVYRFEKKMFWDISVSYFDGDILYSPVIRSSVIFFGGTCPQAAIWTQKLSPVFTIKTISREQYIEKDNQSKRNAEFIPAEPEPLY